jgi:RNA polymerase sigma-70 factor, ECF subfamily
LLCAGRDCTIVRVDERREERDERARTTTLGDLLYAGRDRTRVLEKDWLRLVESIAAGDQHALRELYDRTHRLVFTLIMRITHDRDAAEELTIEVFHDVWRRASRYDASVGTVVAWIMNQARSRAIDRLRFESRKKRVNPYVEPTFEEAADRSDEAPVVRDEGRRLQSALSVLTLDERIAIETAYFSELSYAETAARLEQPLGTIKTRIRSALAKLRQALGARDL